MDRLPAVRGRPLVTLANLAGMPAPLSAGSVAYFAEIATGHIKTGVITRIVQRIRSFTIRTPSRPYCLRLWLAGMPTSS